MNKKTRLTFLNVINLFVGGSAYKLPIWEVPGQSVGAKNNSLDIRDLLELKLVVLQPVSDMIMNLLPNLENNLVRILLVIKADEQIKYWDLVSLVCNDSFAVEDLNSALYELFSLEIVKLTPENGDNLAETTLYVNE